MTDLEADDGLASAAARAAGDARVEQVFICTPDKDLAQCVTGSRVVQFDRRAGALRDEEGVRAKFGVAPASIPDYLALVGDAADGFPGLRGWGAKSAAALLGRYGSIDAIPDDPADWGRRGAGRGPSRGRARRAPRPRPALPGPRHAAQRRAVVRLGRRPPLEGAAAGSLRPLCPAQRPRPLRARPGSGESVRQPVTAPPAARAGGHRRARARPVAIGRFPRGAVSSILHRPSGRRGPGTHTSCDDLRSDDCRNGRKS